MHAPFARKRLCIAVAAAVAVGTAVAIEIGKAYGHTVGVDGAMLWHGCVALSSAFSDALSGDVLSTIVKRCAGWFSESVDRE